MELGQARLQRLPAAASVRVHHILLLHILELIPLRRVTLQTASSLPLSQVPLFARFIKGVPGAHLVAFPTSSLLDKPLATKQTAKGGTLHITSRRKASRATVPLDLHAPRQL